MLDLLKCVYILLQIWGPCLYAVLQMWSYCCLVDWYYKLIKSSITALNIKLLEPLAQGASRFEKSLAPPKIHWPPIFSNDVSPRKTVGDINIGIIFQVFLCTQLDHLRNCLTIVGIISFKFHRLVPPEGDTTVRSDNFDNMEMEDCLTKNCCFVII